MKQKLLIFFSIGLLIFLIDVLFNKDSTNKITIYESELDSLINTWVIQVGRDPTAEEIDGIIKQLIDEEILYREALKLGLDKNDIIIKRRLAQKISFLKQESIDKSPSEEDIQRHYTENSQDYFIDSTFTFSHIYFSNENQAQSRSTSALKSIEQGKVSGLSLSKTSLAQSRQIKKSSPMLVILCAQPGAISIISGLFFFIVGLGPLGLSIYIISYIFI